MYRYNSGVVAGLRDKLIQEYIELTEKYGNLKRDDYVKKSRYGWKYETIFGNYRGLRRQAVTNDNVDTFRTPTKKDMPEKPKTLFINSKKPKRYIILSDLHIPFHDVKLCDKVLEFMGKQNFDGIVINGDFLDLFSISRYASNSLYDLKDISLGREYHEGNLILNKIDSVIEGEKVFIFGNHEARFAGLVKSFDNAKYGDALKSPTEALKLKERGWQVLEFADQDSLILGNIIEVLHGRYTNKYMTNKHLEHSKYNIIFGHSHTLQVFTFADGRVGISFGFLGDLNSNAFNYAYKQSRERWKQGFIVVTFQDGAFWSEPVVVNNDKFIYGGVLY